MNFDRITVEATSEGFDVDGKKMLNGEFACVFRKTVSEVRVCGITLALDGSVSFEGDMDIELEEIVDVESRRVRANIERVQSEPTFGAFQVPTDTTSQSLDFDL